MSDNHGDYDGDTFESWPYSYKVEYKAADRSERITEMRMGRGKSHSGGRRESFPRVFMGQTGEDGAILFGLTR